MERLPSAPVDWVGQDHLGFVINAVFSSENTTLINNWLSGLNEHVHEGIYTMRPEGLHITVLDWVAPLVDYKGTDKRKLYVDLRETYDSAFRAITDSMESFDIQFNEIRVTPSTIILLGHDGGQFQSLRDRFMASVQLPEGGKQPPDIIHSSLARFIAPEIDLTPVQDYADTHPLVLTQNIAEFRLVETRREPMQDFKVIDAYKLAA